MLFHTYGQARVFLAMMYAGLLIGACYDTLALWARLMRAGVALRAALDGVFGAAVALILVLSMVGTNYGEMQPYPILGAACGLVIWAWTLRPVGLAAARLIARAARAVQRAASSSKWTKKVLR